MDTYLEEIRQENNKNAPVLFSRQNKTKLGTCFPLYIG